MSVYSYIEVNKPGEDRQADSELHLGFGHGIGWFYQIGVAGGKKTYQGAEYTGVPEYEQFEERGTLLVYERRLIMALQNYQTAIGACLKAIELGIPGQDGWLRHDLELLFMAQTWYQRGWLKIPRGIVKLDWCEAVMGMRYESLAKWDSPNDNFAFFVELAQDCEDMKTEKISPKGFTKKYQKYSARHRVSKKTESQMSAAEILGGEVVADNEVVTEGEL